MPLDPSIALRAQRPELAPPGQQLQQAMTLKDIAMRQQQTQQQMQQAQQAEQMKQRFAAIVQQGGGIMTPDGKPNEAVLKRIETELDPQFALQLRNDLQKHLMPQQEAAAAAQQQQLTNDRTARLDLQNYGHQQATFQETQRQRQAAEAQARATAQAAAESRRIDDERQSARDAEIGRHNKEQERLSAITASRTGRATAPEPLESVMDPKTGRPVLVPRSQAAGMTPAGGSGGANRKVLSGDAGRIAEFDTSLDDVKVLRGTIAPRDKAGKLTETGATGVTAQLGAATPNWVTEWTGVGSTAKQKQGVIDRVRQVIGKALEGGVLRKEDEVKYTRILPTIGDPVDVVESKLNGLEEALRLRRERLLESLGDGGYDVSGYQKSAPRAPGSSAKKIGRFELVD